MSPPRLAVLTALLAALSPRPLPAQQQPQAPQQPPLLRVVSVDGGPVFVLQMLLEGPGRLSITGSGPQQLLVTADRRIEAGPAEALGDGVLAVVELRPAAWLEAAGDEVATFAKAWRPRVGAVMQLAGLPMERGAALLDDVLALARGAELVTLVVRGGEAAAAAAARPIDAALSVTPQPGSDLHRWTQLLVPGPARSPLTAAGDATLRLDVAVPADRLPALFEPFLDLTAAMQSAPDDFAAARADLARTVRCLDGTVACVLDEAGMRMACGLRDAATYQQLVTSAAALDRLRTQMRRQRIDIEVEPAALEHRGVSAMRSNMLPAQPVPLLENQDGEVISVGGCAPDAWVGVVGGAAPEEAWKAALDDVLDGKMFRRSEAEARSGAIMSCDLTLAGLAAFVPPAQQDDLDFDGYERIHLTLQQNGAGLELHMQLR